MTAKIAPMASTKEITPNANQVPLKVQEKRFSSRPTTLPPITQETLAKAQKARAEKQAYAKANLRRDFLDSGLWDDLAKQAGLRLPNWSAVCTPGQMAKWLRKVGISTTRYLEFSGEKNLAEFRKRNKDWPLRAWVGLILEERANA